MSRTINYEIASAEDLADHFGVAAVAIRTAPSYDDAILSLRQSYRTVRTTALGGAVRCDCVDDRRFNHCIVLR